ncbi:MAG: hypothetical protein H6662_07165 [Ardenticatenaceae bacterium]|nr:hypothetical protein [Anaerolineales bacterium]MCB8921343.1 hypothetical protein [Ardenticatenaceae bacterium]MCB9004033.1 hypothetical protein [Ardenticatenaceae bacterium]
MRLRTFILIILIVIIGGTAATLWVLNNNSNENNAANVDGTAVDNTSGEEPGVPAPTPTPSIRFEPVVVARVDIPIGQRLTSDLLDTEVRPHTNIALQGGYTYSTIEDLIGEIVRTPISEGQAILSPMLALNSTDLASFGSDLALYIDQGKVAIAFPLRMPDEETSFNSALRGVAFAMRPGDFVDVMMTASALDLDPEFGTALPNCTYRVDEQGLVEGRAFLFPAAIQGRLEFTPGINQVIEIVPGALPNGGAGICETAAQPPIPKRVTQLTLQNVEVIWVGTWQTQESLVEKLAPTPAPVVSETPEAEQTGDTAETDTGVNSANIDTSPTHICLSPVTNELIPCPVVRDTNKPDVLILSMTTQDALVLKWALERGIDIDLALRAQGDQTVFFTSSVSLPQIINEGLLFIPEPYESDLAPRVDEAPVPSLPAVAPID